MRPEEIRPADVRSKSRVLNPPLVQHVEALHKDRGAVLHWPKGRGVFFLRAERAGGMPVAPTVGGNHAGRCAGDHDQFGKHAIDTAPQWVWVKKSTLKLMVRTVQSGSAAPSSPKLYWDLPGED